MNKNFNLFQNQEKYLHTISIKNFSMQKKSNLSYLEIRLSKYYTKYIAIEFLTYVHEVNIPSKTMPLSEKNWIEAQNIEYNHNERIITLKYKIIIFILEK